MTETSAPAGFFKAPAARLRHAGSRLRHLSCAAAALQVAPTLLFNIVHPLDGG